MRSRSALWLLLPIVLGAATAAWLVSRAPAPQRVNSEPAGLPVRFALAEAQAIRPRAQGWGNIRAADNWTAVAEVRGTVLRQHPDLENGKLIAAGTTVIEIDPADYELAIAQAEADLATLAAEVAQIDAEAANTDRVLELEEARLALSKADLTRTRLLVDQGTAPQIRADEAERAVLAARRMVTELQNTLELVPVRRERVAAQRARTEAALARARRDLEKTSVTVPFDLRVTGVTTDPYQYVTVGQSLLSGDGVERVEVLAQIPVSTFRRLLAGAKAPADILAAMRSGPGAMLEAELRPIADPSQIWQGRVTRIEGALDPQARTVPVVVEVAAPYAGANPPLRLPLVPNLQVEVTLTGAVLADAVTIPEGALHGEQVFVVGEDDRLDLREVTPAFRQNGLAVITAGLAPGERVVLDDIAPAIPGMALRPVEPEL
ncbi:hypothetical protein SAMN05444007_1055 [Cribrihabitans marinus]|uniref:Multidrug resistance protein MdtA-like C-terminal permuted SH3 domain-containing protein n=1 Tax=Cribrihabitans marinus TaxID=1227549 RepID=A0A1H6Z2C7_9RHOB|nr:HlyD family efflux transporter periplasmic adaptor subunit [Cribrihabitans marinus]GGH31486.1 RND transporter [Cribrihabitans marinus]SEJ47568.1 hypothetical protein SAMN05444007_1055 [Cribrihabitans marinus]